MNDPTTIPQTEWESGTFHLHVSDFQTVLQVKDRAGCIFNAPHASADVSREVLRWLRAVDKNTLYTFLAAVVLEYQVSTHITTKTEEERLVSATMHDDDLIPKVLAAVKAVAQRDETHADPFIEISAVYTYLEAQHVLLPSYVVYSVLKTLEECVPGSCRDIGEGFFRVRVDYL